LVVTKEEEAGAADGGDRCYEEGPWRWEVPVLLDIVKAVVEMAIWEGCEGGYMGMRM